MKMISRVMMLQAGCLVLQAACLAQAPAPPLAHAAPDRAAADAPRTLVPYFIPAGAQAATPDADGFIRRWMLLEPIVKPNRTSTVFTGSYVREALNTQYFPDQFTVVPHKSDKVTVAGQELAWHALDSNNFDVKLFRFAYGLNKTTYGVIFWAVTVVDSPRDIKNARLAVGSNSASMWWLNGDNVAGLFDDRRMVMDDVLSDRVRLKKGRNVLRGAVINGPGLSDFCVRFVDDNGNPIKGLTVTLQ
ncbi:MAG: acetylxylan esterase [Acidobacteriota bacterium]|nr:acetylxylan esterase [Acidobacteriota bacterium]